MRKDHLKKKNQTERAARRRISAMPGLRGKGEGNQFQEGGLWHRIYRY